MQNPAIPSLKTLCAIISAQFISESSESNLRSLPDEVLKEILLYLNPLEILSLEEKFPTLTDFEGSLNH